MIGEERDLLIESILVGDRFRDLDEGAAQELALSIGERGLIHAITVRPVRHGMFALVAGAHRLRAHEIIGSETIRCFVRDLSDHDAEMTEIEENLFGASITPMERAVSTSRFKTDYELRHPETVSGGDRHSDGFKSQTLRPDRFTAVIAQKSGRSERSIQDYAAVGAMFSGEDFEALKGTAIARNFAQIKTLSTLTPEKRQGAIAALADGRAQTLAEAKRVASGMPEREMPDPEAVIFRKIAALLARAKTQTKRRVLDHLQTDLKARR